MATNPFEFQSDSIAAPARLCRAVAPNDTTPLPFTTKAIRATGDGVITFRPIGQLTDVAHPVVNGERIDVVATHIRLTGTTGQASTVIIYG